MLRLALVPLFASAVVLAQDPEGDPETCHDVAARILAPRIAAVEAAERGLAEYDHRNELYAQEQQALVDAYAMTEHIAQAALDAQRGELERQQAAVAEARGAVVTAERARAAPWSCASRP